MGVYIRGMEMPQNCESCQFRRCISDIIMFSWVGCQLDVGIAKKELFKGRHPDCPLVEVKDPHGRLIDADALMAVSAKRLGVINADHIAKAKTVLEAEGKEDG